MTIKHGVAIFSLESAVYETSVAVGIEHRAWVKYKQDMEKRDLDLTDANYQAWNKALVTKQWCEFMLAEYKA